MQARWGIQQDASGCATLLALGYLAVGLALAGAVAWGVGQMFSQEMLGGADE